MECCRCVPRRIPCAPVAPPCVSHAQILRFAVTFLQKRRLPYVHEVGIIRWLPHLRKINDQDVTDLERADACNLQAALCPGEQEASQHTAACAALWTCMCDNGLHGSESQNLNSSALVTCLRGPVAQACYTSSDEILPCVNHFMLGVCRLNAKHDRRFRCL